MNTRKQKGIVLLVSLMLLLMLTLLAIATVNRSTLQLRIASNGQQQNAAFQAAETGIQQWASAYFAESSNENFPANWTNKAIGGSERSSVTAVSTGPCPNFGIGRVSLNCFDIQSKGEICDSGDCSATAVHRQGGQRRQLN